MIIISGLSQPLKAVGKYITSWAEESGRVMVEVGSAVRRAACLRCSKRSSRLHGHYRRSIADSPSFRVPVTLGVEIGRFKCVNRRCPQRTFSECIEPLAVARRCPTVRLIQAVPMLGYALGGEAAARLGGKLGMPVSGSTVLRELRRTSCPPPEASPVVVSIDDRAIARNHHYGTILVDLKRRCPIELLEGRDTTSVIPWLQAQPGVEVIARDRAGAYADAARMATPGAQQVADRGHLMADLCEADERLLLRHGGRLREAARQVSKALRLEAQPAGSLADTNAEESTASPLKA